MNHWPITQDLPLTPEKDDKELDHFSNLKPVTKIISKETTVKRSYVNVPNELRLQLVEAVYLDGETIKLAAKRLGINYSSAKSICQIYKQEGRSDRKISKWTNPIESKATKTQIEPVSESSEREFSVAEFVDKEKTSVNNVQASGKMSMKESVLMDNSSFMESYSAVYKEKNPIERQAAQEIKVITEHSSFFKPQPLESQIAQQIKQFHKLDYQTVKPDPIQDNLMSSIYTEQLSHLSHLSSTLDSQIQQFARDTLSTIDRTILSHIMSLENTYPYPMTGITGIEAQYQILPGSNFCGAKQSYPSHFQPQIYPMHPSEQHRHLNHLYSVSYTPLQHHGMSLKAFQNSNINNYASSRPNFSKQDTKL